MVFSLFRGLVEGVPAPAAATVWPEPYELAYRQAYGERDLRDRRRLQLFGAVPDHRYWGRPLHNPAAGQVMPLEAGSVDLFYCGHALERLTADQARAFLQDIRRVLRPGGVLRLAALDAVLCYQAWLRRDVFVNLHYGLAYPFGAPGANTFTRETMSIWLVNQIAGQLVQSAAPDHAPVYAGKDAELDALLASMPMAAAFDHLCGQVDPALQAAAPSLHCSWWSRAKAKAALAVAGFSQILPSSSGGCIDPLMRDRATFDGNIPTLSFYIDAIA